VRRLLGIAVLALLATLGLPTAAQADTSDFTFDSFDADYTLTRLDDGTSHLEVVETIVAEFPDYDQNRGIIRAIPSDYDGVDLNTAIRYVQDENGNDVPYEVSDTGDFLELALGTDDFVYGETTYVIAYMQENVIRSFEDTHANEFYWDINGTGWEQPFGRVSGVLHVDPSLVAALTGNAACYYGPADSTNQCAVDASGPDIAVSVDDLGPGDNVTLSVGFAQDTFVTPVPTRGVPQPIPFWLHLLSGGIGALSIAGAIAAIVARARSGRSAKGRGTIIPQYSEPEGITILQAAALENRTASGLPAALVRLAVRKNIRILAYAVEGHDEPYSLQFLTADRADPEDQAILTALFGESPEPGEVSPFGDSEQEEARALTALSDAAAASIQTAGFRVRGSGIGIGVLLVVLQVALAVVAVVTLVVSLSELTNVSPLLIPVMIVGTVAFFVTAIASVRPLLYTDKGIEAHEYLQGMKMYLTLAEKDRLRYLQSPTGADRVDAGNNLEMIKLYEKLLPWAVMWGVEDQWVKELEVRVAAEPTAQPDWYVSQTGFNAGLFAGTLGGLRSGSTYAPPASSWSSSGSGFGSTFSGGSMGGGFSGGGGGGGGGGGR